jgi:small subunit ribosomal protein S4
MATQVAPSCKRCRREGIKLFLKGERCNSKRCAMEKSALPPGQHGQVRSRPSEYRLRLRQKQQARRIYGIMERQFRRYFEIAERQSGSTGENLLVLLETRLDNAIFRIGLSPSRVTARQLCRHGHFLLNGKIANIPSQMVKAGDVITVKEKSRGMVPIKAAADIAKAKAVVPVWLEANFDNLTGKVLHKPTKEEIASPLQEQLIVEFYSGK